MPKYLSWYRMMLCLTQHPCTALSQQTTCIKTLILPLFSSSDTIQYISPHSPLELVFKPTNPSPPGQDRTTRLPASIEHARRTWSYNQS
ncbi:hypothetical protein GGR57DRAFT_386008 [Xylariaceae sp. FL1272]|nr:hypothetical protein GGR57DRAFT_386008 [Xylariaceae sp. FL1272]